MRSSTPYNSNTAKGMIALIFKIVQLEEVFRCCATNKFSMAMGITLLNKTTLSTMTLAQMARESKSTT
jgi:hypothetical protein